MFFELKEKHSLGENPDFYNFTGMFGVLVCIPKNMEGGASENGDGPQDHLDGKGFFGPCVCRKKKGDEGGASLPAKPLVLKAFSGALAGHWNIKGWCPPLFDESGYKDAVSVNDEKIHLLSAAPDNESPEQKTLRNSERLRLCNETLSRIYRLYRFSCSDGVLRTFSDIQEMRAYQSGAPDKNAVKLLPTGTGDCCAPKLFGEAFSRGLVPVSLAEFYWNGGKGENSGKALTDCCSGPEFFPPCDEKCGFILPAILGLKILYRDKNIIVVEKPGGLLSVPGRGPKKQDCVVTRVQRLFPATIRQPAVHRLDMDTSGLMVLAFDEESHRALNAQFEGRSVHKTYIAVLDGLVREEGGRIELKHRVDIENRPVQIADDIYGRLAVTVWKRLRVWNLGGRTVTSILFTPQTGRTHQLRFASRYGLGSPIVGDNIYGISPMPCGREIRLLLHANYLCFTHPVNGKKMEFTSVPAFNY